MEIKARQFDFGANWTEFSAMAATPERAAQARAHFSALLGGVALEGRRFLDIGFGQGFSLLSAVCIGGSRGGLPCQPQVP